MKTQHESSPDGESTEKWAIRGPGFIGSIKQLTHCARCGNIPPPKRHDEPRKYRDISKITFHFVCDQCYAELPE